MFLRPYTCVWDDSHSIGKQKARRPTEEGGCKLSDKLGETGKGALKMSMMAGRPLWMPP